MASRLSRQAFSTTARAARSVRSKAQPAKRFMSADATAHAHEFKPKSDMPWIIGAAVVSVPALAYLLRDTLEIKKKIAAGHHGHDSHDAHAAHGEAHDDHASKAVAEDDHASKAVAKDDEAEASSSTNAADDSEGGAKAEESTSDAAAEPPKDEKESEKEEEKEESK